MDYKTKKKAEQETNFEITEETRRRTILYYRYGVKASVRGKDPETITLKNIVKESFQKIFLKSK